MDEVAVDLNFPMAGVDQSNAFASQKPRQLPWGEFGRTCADARNVRGFEPSGQRARGGSRPGLAKYVSAALVADWIVQECTVLVGSGYAPPGGSVELNAAGRVVTLVAVSQGNVYTSNDRSTWTTATNNTGATPALNFTGVVRSAPNNQRLYFADGVNYAYYDPSTDSVERWTATAGALPVDSLGNAPRLICTWRGRTVVSGLLFDPHNWFMSAVNDPHDWDYGPEETTSSQAVAGNNAPQGLVGDVVTSLCPYNDDVLVFFGDHSVYVMAGDPLAGGQIDLVTDAIGGTFGTCWAKDGYGNLYFLSNKLGLYRWTPGQQPQRISQPVEQLLRDIDTGDVVSRLAWNDREQGLHVFLSRGSEPSTDTHLFWEERTGAWWPDTFGDNDHNPVCCCVYDGNDADDRVVLIGSWDGYVRSIDRSATDDDGTVIQSYVFLGPITSKNLDDLLLKEIQGVLGEESGSVTWAVHVGDTAEEALSSTAILTGTLSASRNLTMPVRRSGHAIYVKLSSSSAWSMEQIRAVVSGKGKVRRRGA